MARVVRGLRALDVHPTTIISSPAVRAIETARILRRGLDGAPVIAEAEWLAPGTSLTATRAGLRSMSPEGDVAVVGHEPDLGALAAWLLGARAPVAFKKGGVAAFEIARWPPKPPAHLIWFATPALLRAIADASS